MSQRSLRALIVLALGGLALWWILMHGALSTMSPHSSSTEAKGSNSPAPISSSAAPNNAPKIAPPASPAGASPSAAQPPSSPAQAPENPILLLEKPISDKRKYANEMQGISLMLRDYRTLFHGNPVGSNAEIMQRLMGSNPKHARLGPPQGERLNEQGELIDRWGTPYFFHQQSATEMEIHSAGPDKILGTADDIVVR
jgi:hypothetical protein